jgi:phosphatidylserine decarboxylase
VYLIAFSVVVGGAIFLFFLQFFRNPPRTLPQTPHKLLAPADGRVVYVGEAAEPEVLGTKALQISIFMSPFNVHVNRYPADGEVVYVKHHPGKYLVAWHPKSSELNERCTTAIRLTDGRIVVVRQIAGIVARRIVNYAQVGKKVKAGQEMGFIKFGSRADIFWSLDSGLDPKIKINDKVVGGETILA